MSRRVEKTGKKRVLRIRAKGKGRERTNKEERKQEIEIGRTQGKGGKKAERGKL